jgi:hypothetical protein
MGILHRYLHVEEGNYIPVFHPVEKNSPLVKRHNIRKLPEENIGDSFKIQAQTRTPCIRLQQLMK